MVQVEAAGGIEGVFGCADQVAAGARHRVRRRWPMQSNRVADRSSLPCKFARVKAMACTPPRDKGVPLSRWSGAELAEQAISDGICGSISPATIRRWLSEDALKPRQHR